MLKEQEDDVLAAATAHGEKIFADMNDFKSSGGFAVSLKILCIRSCIAEHVAMA